MKAFTGLHRKSLIRLMNSNLTRKPRRRERGRTYGPEMDEALIVIWEADELARGSYLASQLGKISISTVRRHLPSAP